MVCESEYYFALLTTCKWPYSLPLSCLIVVFLPAHAVYQTNIHVYLQYAVEGESLSYIVCKANLTRPYITYICLNGCCIKRWNLSDRI